MKSISGLLHLDIRQTPNEKSVVLVMVPILVIAQAGILVQFAAAGYHFPFIKDPRKRFTAIHVVWWTNETGNNEVFIRSSTDGGNTFGDIINLSNTNSSSTRAEIDSDGINVVVTWWETNQTDDTPVMRVSNDNGRTFGPLLKLESNGTLGG